MKKVLLCALNASFTHTPLALYALRAYCHAYESSISLASFTINQPEEWIIRQLYERKPDLLGFSCAIWNITATVRIARVIRQVLPHTLLLFGGPEVFAEYEPFLIDQTADVIVTGEGEEPFLKLLAFFIDGIGTLDAIPGIAFCKEGRITVTPPAASPNMRALPFPYTDGFDALEHKALYYEASRGCPFRCAYCLSSISIGTHLKPLTEVFRDLKRFLEARVYRIKFTDRTFNANKTFSLSIWRFLIENDNGFTGFHFEVAADLLDGEGLDLLQRARPGLFQFEIGVQSTCEKTLLQINRQTHLERLFENVRQLRGFNNIHLHLDLIAGLPGDDLATFSRSFNALYAVSPHQIQIGFLKLLKGTTLRTQAEALGLVYTAHPPYEILQTPDLTFDDIVALKKVEEVVELFYNADKFQITLRYLNTRFQEPFALYQGLADFWQAGRYHERPHSKIGLYEILRLFCLSRGLAENLIQDLLCFDLLSNENEKSPPSWLVRPLTDADKRLAREMALSKDERLVAFEWDVRAWAAKESATIEKRPHYLRFRYPQPGRQNIFTAMERVTALKGR